MFLWINISNETPKKKKTQSFKIWQVDSDWTDVFSCSLLRVFSSTSYREAYNWFDLIRSDPSVTPAHHWDHHFMISSLSPTKPLEGIVQSFCLVSSFTLHNPDTFHFLNFTEDFLHSQLSKKCLQLVKQSLNHWVCLVQHQHFLFLWCFTSKAAMLVFLILCCKQACCCSALQHYYKERLAIEANSSLNQWRMTVAQEVDQVVH